MLRKVLVLAIVVAIGAFCLSGCKKIQPAPTPAPPAPKAAVEQKPAAEPVKEAPVPQVKEEPKPEPAPPAPKAEPAKPVPPAPETEPAKPAPPATAAPAEPNTAK